MARASKRSTQRIEARESSSDQFMNEVVGDVRPALLTLLGAVGLVLLIACANVAGLLLAQHAGRSKEIAIRAALGAGRARLVRQFFIEGLLLSLFGTVAGVALAALGTKVLLQFVPAGVPRLAQVSLDWRVLGFTMLIALGTCLIFGLVPAWHASKPDLHTALEQSGRTLGPGASQLALPPGVGRVSDQHRRDAGDRRGTC